MDNQFNETELFKGGRTLSIMPTYACNANCKNCGTVSSPNDRNNLPLETIISSIEQAKHLGFMNVVFTGGEATLRWKDLVQAIQFAHNLDMPTRLVTNAHWANNEEEANLHIKELHNAGLNEINYSTGDEHVKYVPLNSVVNGIIAAIDHSLSLAVMIELTASRVLNRTSLTEHSKIKMLNETDKQKIRILESPWMPLNPLEIGTYPEGIAINRNNISSVSGCDSVLQTYVVQADGRIGACCGLGMRITPELNVGFSTGTDFLARAIKESESDFLKLLLHYKGPERILEWAASKNPEIKWENLYAHKCQACLRVYKDSKVADVLRHHHKELFAEVLQSVWLEEEYYRSLIEENFSPDPSVNSLTSLSFS
jgi:organic radical activating enzyme